MTMFGGKRNFNSALGYLDSIGFEAYRQRYRRGGIARRIVNAFPNATWAHGAEIIEDATPKVWTPFEEDIAALMNRTNMWDVFRRADILAGVGRYSVVLIGAPGQSLAEELPNGKPGDITYFSCYGEATARISAYETNENDERFSFPTEYELINLTTSSSKSSSRKVHWTRIIHIVDGVLDNMLEGDPRLEACWDDLDDLKKVTGGGSEAFWKTVFQGMQIDIDKDMELDEPSVKELDEQIDQFEHNMRRTMKTRGVKVTTLGADTSDFSPQADTLLDLISGTSEIPKRILLGSERGELASTQDRENWHDRVSNRRTQYAGPMIVHPLVNLLIAKGYLRAPKKDYWVAWPQMGLTLTETSAISERLSKVNAQMGETVITGADIRDKVLHWDPLQEDDLIRDPALDAADPLIQDPDDEPVEEDVVPPQ
jgi:hypothetical protein